MGASRELGRNSPPLQFRTIIRSQRWRVLISIFAQFNCKLSNNFSKLRHPRGCRLHCRRPAKCSTVPSDSQTNCIWQEFINLLREFRWIIKFSSFGSASRKLDFLAFFFLTLLSAPSEKKFLSTTATSEISKVFPRKKLHFYSNLTFFLSFLVVLSVVFSSSSPFQWNFLRFWRFYPATTSPSLCFFDWKLFFLSIWSLRGSKATRNTFNNSTFLYRVMTKFIGSWKSRQSCSPTSLNWVEKFSPHHLVTVDCRLHHQLKFNNGRVRRDSETSNSTLVWGAMGEAKVISLKTSLRLIMIYFHICLVHFHPSCVRL